MTFCLGMKCDQGLLAIADTRITSGSETSFAKKISVHQGEGHSMFVLTSGLRSLRDKAITYFEERLSQDDAGIDKMFKAANILAEEIRRVWSEEQQWLADGGLQFDLHCIFGGQLGADQEHHLYLIYPQGNWIEVGAGTPYVIIGESSYGKPLLDRVWRHGSTLSDALLTGLLSFDATRTSASDVDYPLDTVIYQRDSFEMREHSFTEELLQPIEAFWGRAITDAVEAAGPLAVPLYGALNAGPLVPNHLGTASPIVR